jgi:hypothetical protein
MPLSASRGASKNQCADKGFSIAIGWQICERQFALSCHHTHQPHSRIADPRRPAFELKTFNEGQRIATNAIPIIAIDPRVVDPTKRSVRTRREHQRTGSQSGRGCAQLLQARCRPIPIQEGVCAGRLPPRKNASGCPEPGNGMMCERRGPCDDADC